LNKHLDFCQRKERIKKGRKRGRKEGRKKGRRKEGRKEVRKEGNRKGPTIHTALFSHLFIEDSLIVFYNTLCTPIHIFIGWGKETQELPKSP
jgi:DNA invertase Pin-like site-specific DNA recombinase